MSDDSHASALIDQLRQAEQNDELPEEIAARHDLEEEEDSE